MIRSWERILRGHSSGCSVTSLSRPIVLGPRKADGALPLSGGSLSLAAHCSCAKRDEALFFSEPLPHQLLAS